jgi:hypothetical protein
MTAWDRAWGRAAERRLGSVAPHLVAVRRGEPGAELRLRLYLAAHKLHRWLWVRGVRLW